MFRLTRSLTLARKLPARHAQAWRGLTVTPIFQRAFFGAGSLGGTVDANNSKSTTSLNELRMVNSEASAPPAPPLPFVNPINTHYSSPQEVDVKMNMTRSRILADATAESINQLIANGQLQEALHLYDQHRGTMGSEFFAEAHVPWAVSLATAYFEMGLAAQPNESSLQYLKSSFDLSCDAILMYLGTSSPQYQELVATEWYASSPHRFRDLCILFSKQAPEANTLEIATCRVTAARALFALAYGATQASDSYMALYDLSAHFWNASLSTFLETDAAAKETVYPLIFESRRMLALCYRRRRQYEWAWLVLEDGLRECKQADEAIKGVYWADIGALCLDARRFNSGVEAFERALRCRSTHATPSFKAHVLTGYAQCLGGMANFKGAVVAFNDAIESAELAVEKNVMTMRESVEIHATALDFVSHVDALVKQDPEVGYIRQRIAASTEAVLEQWESDIETRHKFGGGKNVVLDVDDLDIPMLRMDGKEWTAWNDGAYLTDTVLETERLKHKDDMPHSRREGIDTLM